MHPRRGASKKKKTRLGAEASIGCVLGSDLQVALTDQANRARGQTFENDKKLARRGASWPFAYAPATCARHDYRGRNGESDYEHLGLTPIWQR